MTSVRQQNWSGAVQFAPTQFHAPADEQQVARVVAAAYAGKHKVRVVGSRHSFVPFWNDGDVILDLQALSGLVAVDAASGLAEIRAGTVLADLGAPLWAAGFSLANMGDIDRQSLAGALSTGTHGTGPGLGGLATTVAGVALVNGRGELLEIGARGNPTSAVARDARLDGLAVAVGALGVLTRVTLAVLPRYGLSERQWQLTPEECLEQLSHLVQATRHFEFFYTPKDDVCHCKSLAVIAAPAQPNAIPELPFGIAGQRDGASFRIFPSAREAKFNEMEYSVPAEQGVECFRAIRRLLREDFPKISWPVEYRTVAGDQLWLSPNGGRASVTISIHQAAERDPEAFFRAAEAIFLRHGGRPHWGKQHFLDAAALAPRYPCWGQYQQLRDALDAPRTFSNHYITQLLGP